MSKLHLSFISIWALDAGPRYSSHVFIARVRLLSVAAISYVTVLAIAWLFLSGWSFLHWKVALLSALSIGGLTYRFYDRFSRVMKRRRTQRTAYAAYEALHASVPFTGQFNTGGVAGAVLGTAPLPGVGMVLGSALAGFIANMKIGDMDPERREPGSKIATASGTVATRYPAVLLELISTIAFHIRSQEKEGVVGQDALVEKALEEAFAALIVARDRVQEVTAAVNVKTNISKMAQAVLGVSSTTEGSGRPVEDIVGAISTKWRDRELRIALIRAVIYFRMLELGIDPYEKQSFGRLDILSGDNNRFSTLSTTLGNFFLARATDFERTDEMRRDLFMDCAALLANIEEPGNIFVGAAKETALNVVGRLVRAYGLRARDSFHREWKEQIRSIEPTSQTAERARRYRELFEECWEPVIAFRDERGVVEDVFAKSEEWGNAQTFP